MKPLQKDRVLLGKKLVSQVYMGKELVYEDPRKIDENGLSYSGYADIDKNDFDSSAKIYTLDNGIIVYLKEREGDYIFDYYDQDGYFMDSTTVPIGDSYDEVVAHDDCMYIFNEVSVRKILPTGTVFEFDGRTLIDFLIYEKKVESVADWVNGGRIDYIFNEGCPITFMTQSGVIIKLTDMLDVMSCERFVDVYTGEDKTAIPLTGAYKTADGWLMTNEAGELITFDKTLKEISRDTTGVAEKKARIIRPNLYYFNKKFYSADTETVGYFIKRLRLSNADVVFYRAENYSMKMDVYFDDDTVKTETFAYSVYPEDIEVFKDEIYINFADDIRKFNISTGKIIKKWNLKLENYFSMYDRLEHWTINTKPYYFKWDVKEQRFYLVDKPPIKQADGSYKDDPDAKIISKDYDYEPYSRQVMYKGEPVFPERPYMYEKTVSKYQYVEPFYSIRSFTISQRGEIYITSYMQEITKFEQFIKIGEE